MNIDLIQYDGLIKQAAKELAKIATEHYIQVVIVEPHKKPYKTTIPNTLEAFHNIVGGDIENKFIGYTKNKKNALGVVYNENHKERNLPFNRRILTVDIITGTFLVTAYNAMGENVTLENEEAERQIRRFTSYEVYI